jgi:hypothetical protein
MLGKNAVPPASRNAEQPDRIKKKVTIPTRDKLSSYLSEKVSTVILLAAPNPGDKCKLELDIEVPIEPGFIGFNLTIEGEQNDDTTFKLGVKFIVSGGGSLGASGKLKGKAGGYVEAQGKNSKHAMELISYGLYRRLRESSVLPREITNKIWGDQTDSKGYEASEEWAAGVEMGLLKSREGEDFYTETGGAAALEGEADIPKIAKLGGEIEVTSGSRTNKESIQNLKLKKYREQQGQAPLHEVDITDLEQRKQVEEALISSRTKRGAQKKSGEGVMTLKFTGKADANSIAGEVSFKVIFQSQNREKLSQDRRLLNYAFNAWELEVFGQFKLPLRELTDRDVFKAKLLQWLVEVESTGKNLRATAQKQLTKAKMGLAGVNILGDFLPSFISEGERFVPEIKLPDAPTQAQSKSELALEIAGVMGMNADREIENKLIVRIVNVRGVESPVFKALAEQKTQIFRYPKTGYAKEKTL